MTRRTKIRTAHVTAATIAMTATNGWTAYAQSQSHHTASGAWDGPIVIGWLLVFLSALWLVVLGCYGLYRLAVALWTAQPSGRPTPGSPGRAPSLSRREWRQLDKEYAAYRRNTRIVEAMARPAIDDTQPMLRADIAALEGAESLIDAFAAYGIAPERVVRAAEADVPPSEREYPELADAPPTTVWTVEPAGLSGQGVVLHAWFGNAFKEAA